MSEALVKFKILDATGFSVHEKPAAEALDYIKGYLQQKNGWFYIDKALSNIDSTTPEDLQAASIITITNVIIGGVDPFPPYVALPEYEHNTWRPS